MRKYAWAILLVVTAAACDDGAVGAGADATPGVGPDAAPDPRADASPDEEDRGVDDLEAQLTVDLAARRPGVPAMTGLLSSVGSITPDRILDALAPRFLRGDLSRFLVDPRFPIERRWAFADLARIHARDIQRVFMMDTTWGHPAKLERFPENVFPDGTPMWLCRWCSRREPNGPPWDPAHGGGFEKWRAHVSRTTRELVRVVDGYNAAHGEAPIDLESEFIFDVWNEPNNDVFWETGRYNEYYETYCVAENAIREILPNARVAGPSFASYLEPRIQGLMDYCMGRVDPSYTPVTDCRRCRVDVLNWHANTADIGDRPIDPNDPPYGFERIAESVQHAHAAWIDNPNYADLGIGPLYFFEGTGSGYRDFHRPGEAVRSLQAFEDSGLDGAIRGCWDEECFDTSVAGLYNGPTLREDAESDSVEIEGDWVPRATAWVFTSYPAGVASRVSVTSTEPALAVLASGAGAQPEAVQIIVGHARQTGVPAGDPIAPVIALEHIEAAPALAEAAEIEAEILYLPYTCAPDQNPMRCGLQSLPAPQSTRVRATVRDGRAVFPTRPLGIHEAMVIFVRVSQSR